MARIPDQFIDELISRSDIAEIIDHRVPLKRAGSEFSACCPFHNENTPSFTVSPAKQFYHCFGCGAHGTVISFLMEYENMAFLDAIDTLAAQAGMQVPMESRPDDKTREQMAGLYAIVEHADQWFQTQLKTHPDAQEAIDYLKNRGLDGQTAANFGVGFAPDGWDNLMQAMGEASFENLAETGLIIEKKEDDESVAKRRYYDRFRGRLMFPIEDYRGKLVGFGGRVIGKGEPKYLNSPETKLFHKGSELYGFHRARRNIGKLDEVLVVEGYMDVVGLAQCGVNNAVATLGTATTPAHLQRMFRAASKVVFCFDGDRAGKKAAWRAMENAMPFMQDGRQIRFLILPEGEDPDSLIRKLGKQDFQTRVLEAISLDAFLFDSLTAKLDMSQMDQRAKLATLAKPLLQNLPQGSFKTLMFAHLSELVGVTQHEDDMPKAPVQNHLAQHKQASTINQADMQQSSFAPQQEIQLSTIIKHAISALIQSPELIETANEFVFDMPNANEGFRLLDELIGMVNVTPNIKTAQLLERYRDHKYSIILSELAAKNLDIEDDLQETYLRDTLTKLAKESIQLKIETLLRKGMDLNKTERDTLKTLLKQKAQF